jgi:hypothetical protein
MADKHGIQDFYAVAQEREFARDFQFKVSSLGPFTEKDLIYLTTADLPGKSITNQTVPYMGLPFNIPGSVVYDGSDNWAVTFRCDEALNIRNRMEAYMTEVFDAVSDTGGKGKYGVPIQIATMELLGKSFETIRKYSFIGLYPKILGPQTYDITGTGTVITFPATFAYQFWIQGS